ncbi:hypothetical protein PUN28_012698 [Cardiocondyla obscurior]|uniref:Uncharacterized protein n=1 Tax=Cardiocondyla obscurior TaxID=286306 RepID=A0AAW2FGL7_9HYME
MLRHDDEEPSASLRQRNLTTGESIGEETWRRVRVVSAGTTENWGTSRTKRTSWRRKRWFAGGREGQR